MWTITHAQILTLDNLMLRGLSLANWCCMCCCNEETVDHLLLLCPTAHWVMPIFIASLLFCWWQWVEKHNSYI